MMNFKNQLLSIVAPWLAAGLIALGGWNLRAHAEAIDDLQTNQGESRVYLERELGRIREVQAEIRTDVQTIKRAVTRGNDAIR